MNKPLAKGSPYKLPGWVSLNPITGCGPANYSDGCRNCWARAVARDRHGDKEFKPTFHPERLGDITGPRGSRKVYVMNFMGDLWADGVDPDWQNSIFTAFRDNPQHQFIVCTKRSGSLARFIDFMGWKPLPNVWLGITAENEGMRMRRTHELACIKGWNKWISLEPLLGPVTLPERYMYGVKWVVVGCESGPKRRECRWEWIINVVNQCKALGIPCYVKQIQSGAHNKVVYGWDVPGRDDFFPWELRVRQLPEELVKGVDDETD